MKATGIVRRIDDLGRVVVPKEIRRTLRIREGDPLEIYTDKEGEIILKKYSPMGELNQFSQQYVECLYQTSGHVSMVCDRDQIIGVSGVAKKEFLGKELSKELELAINNRENIIANKGERNFIKITQGEEEFYSEIIITIICEGDAIGALLLLSKDSKVKLGEVEQKLALTGANFLGKQMEA